MCNRVSFHPSNSEQSSYQATQRDYLSLCEKRSSLVVLRACVEHWNSLPGSHYFVDSLRMYLGEVTSHDCAVCYGCSLD